MENSSHTELLFRVEKLLELISQQRAYNEVKLGDIRDWAKLVELQARELCNGKDKMDSGEGISGSLLDK